MKLKELCELHNIPYDSKNPSRSRLKLEQRFELRQISKQHYEIVRELTSEEMSQIKTYIHMKPIIKECLCTALANVNGNILQGSIKEYYRILSIVNNNYKYFTYSDLNELKKKYMINNNIPLENNILYYEFCGEIDTMFRRIIKECFKELENELLIMYSKHLTFVYQDKNGMYTTKEIINPDERENFLSVGRKRMLEKGYNNWEEVPYIVKKELREQISRDLGIYFFYDRYDVIINKNYMPKRPLVDIKLEVNNLAIEKINKSKQGVLKEWDFETTQDCINTLIKI